LDTALRLCRPHTILPVVATTNCEKHTIGRGQHSKELKTNPASASAPMQAHKHIHRIGYTLSFVVIVYNKNPNNNTHKHTHKKKKTTPADTDILSLDSQA
jgi:hypothetical protein